MCIRDSSLWASILLISGPLYFANRIIAYCAFSIFNPSVSARECHIPARQPAPRLPDTAAIPAAISRKDWIRSVSYTHLDVYKRQKISDPPLLPFMRFSPKDCGLTEETASGFRLETMRSICRTALIGSMHARFWHTLGRSATLFSAKTKSAFFAALVRCLFPARLRHCSAPSRDSPSSYAGIPSGSKAARRHRAHPLSDPGRIAFFLHSALTADS